jgi:hypothetical protein
MRSFRCSLRASRRKDDNPRTFRQRMRRWLVEPAHFCFPPAAPDPTLGDHHWPSTHILSQRYRLYKKGPREVDHGSPCSRVYTFGSFDQQAA